MLSDCDQDAAKNVRMTPNATPPSLRAQPIANARGPRDVTGQRGLGDNIVNALNANLARGYLESEERFRQIVEGLDDCVALTDVKLTELFFVNTAYERIWGRTRASLYADPTSFLEGVHPQDRARVRETVFNDPHAGFDLEFRVVRPEGDERWVWSRGFPVTNDQGEVYRIASISEDITDRKAIIASHERLVRGFTHDVRNPLGAADGYLSLLEIGVKEEMTAAQLETVGRARRCIRTALNLVTQLLEIERAKAGELRIDWERVDLGELARGCVEDFGPAADAKDQSLTWQLPAGNTALVVESDRTRLRQILSNLISNAVKYTQPGGRIIVSVRNADASAPAGLGRCVVLAVADNGPGIAPEKRNMLFREFTRLDPDAAEGSGIGLAISQSIAGALGAAITFRSTPGVGSTFKVWVPALHSPA